MSLAQSLFPTLAAWDSMSDGGDALASALAVIPPVVALWKLQVIIPSLCLIRPLDCIIGVLGRDSNECTGDNVKPAWKTDNMLRIELTNRDQRSRSWSHAAPFFHYVIVR